MIFTQLADFGQLQYILILVLGFRLKLQHRLTSSGPTDAIKINKKNRPARGPTGRSEQILSGLVVTVSNKRSDSKR